MILFILTLFSGLLISSIAAFYSILGLMTIFAAAPIPIMIMGSALEIGKLVSTVWLKQNWTTSPIYIKLYLIISIVVLMLITSVGCFGFLSKAHLDQGVPTGDVAAKIALYDEKIKTEKEVIDAARKSLSQMDATVDQTISRSTTEQGATAASQLRKSQAKERAALQKDVATSQKNITTLNQERAPIAAELRKIEVEVGPVKYIAAFFYGTTEPAILEKAVTWVIIILIIVFDPLAVILLLASQISFQNFRERKLALADIKEEIPIVLKPTSIVEDIIVSEESAPPLPEPVPEEPEFDISKHEYLKQPWISKVPGIEPIGPIVYIPEPVVVPEPVVIPEPVVVPEPVVIPEPVYESMAYPGATIRAVAHIDNHWKPAEVVINTIEDPVPIETYVQNEDQQESNQWTKTMDNVIDQEQYKKLAQENLEIEIEAYAQLVRNKEINMEEVPEILQPMVMKSI